MPSPGTGTTGSKNYMFSDAGTTTEECMNDRKDRDRVHLAENGMSSGIREWVWLLFYRSENGDLVSSGLL
jgi:hypothetical protein